MNEAEERADRIQEQIDSLTEDLIEARTVAGWLEKKIQALHVKRNAIFHEEDTPLCDCGIVNGPHAHSGPMQWVIE